MEQIIFHLILFGPGCLGLLILAITCLVSNRLRWLVVACNISVILLLVSCAFTCAVMGLSWGDSDALKLPWKVFAYGITAIATLTVAKTIHIGCLDRRSRK